VLHLHFRHAPKISLGFGQRIIALFTIYDICEIVVREVFEIDVDLGIYHLLGGCMNQHTIKGIFPLLKLFCCSKNQLHCLETDSITLCQSDLSSLSSDPCFKEYMCFSLINEK